MRFYSATVFIFLFYFNQLQAQEGLNESSAKVIKNDDTASVKESQQLAWANEKAYKEFTDLRDKAIDQNNLYNIREAITLEIKANKIAAKNVGKTHQDYIQSKLDLALYYNANEQFDLVSTHLMGAKKILDQGTYKKELFHQYYFSLGRYYLNSKNPTKGIESLREALDINTKHINDNALLADVLGYLGDCYHDLKKFKLAISTYKTFFNTLKKENYSEKELFYEIDITGVYVRYADALYETKNYLDAIYYLKKSGQLYRKYQGEISEDVSLIANRLYFCYEKLGDTTNALKYGNLQDSIDRKLKQD